MTQHNSHRQPAGDLPDGGDTSGSPGDERLWQAWRYVSDELNADERSAFEDLLAECQDAREAVAEAVEMAHLLRVAEAESMPVTVAGVSRVMAEVTAEVTAEGSKTPRSGAVRRTSDRVTGSETKRAARSLWSSRLSWMVMGAAASLLLVVGLRMVPPMLAPATTESPIVSVRQAELALAWSETRDRMLSELAGGDASLLLGRDEMLAATADRELADTAGMPTFLQADPMGSVATPDWMMAALRAESGDAGETVPESGEEI